MMRADVYLVEYGFAESRTRAARLISEGKIIIDGKKIEKASESIAPYDHCVEIIARDPYVSRGGIKLAAALDEFRIDVSGKKCIDIGASTGGFTDCLLKRGALSVCAVDSGRGQLHPSVACDERVRSIEGFNARELDEERFGRFELAVMDVSFISQTLIHPAISRVLCDGGCFIGLIKPQFEAGRAALGKNGIVKDARDRERSIVRVLESAVLNSLEPVSVMRSPIEGGDGNVEYLAYFIKRPCTDAVKYDIGSFKLKQL